MLLRAKVLRDCTACAAPGNPCCAAAVPSAALGRPAVRPIPSDSFAARASPLRCHRRKSEGLAEGDADRGAKLQAARALSGLAAPKARAAAASQPSSPTSRRVSALPMPSAACIGLIPGLTSGRFGMRAAPATVSVPAKRAAFCEQMLSMRLE